MKVLMVLALALCTLPGVPAAAADAGEETLSERMEDARERLEAAARELAELGASLGEGAVEIVRDIRIGGNRAMLGVNIGTSRGEGGKGVAVLGVTPGGPADKAGIRRGDAIVSVDGHDLDPAGDGSGGRALLEHMKTIEPGEEVRVTYERDGTRDSVDVVTEAISPHRFAFEFGPEFEFQLPDLGRLDLLERLHSRWGDMELAALSPGLGAYFGTDEGLLVVRAPEDDEIDLRDGDVILRIDGRAPESPSHAMRILRSYAPGERMVLEIVRDKRRSSLEVVLSERDEKLKRSRTLRRPAALGPDATA